MALGYDGVFVAQPPYLLFYADRDHDDVPDGDPEVLLQGFGMEDAHAFANSLTWGPDGWLYGAQGSTATADIRGIGFQQGVWRYHPETRQFELFAEGGGNTWGLDFDRFGNLFAGGNTVEPLVHHVQGAYYVKGFGKHGPLHNPHAYGYFQPVQHLGYIGDSLTGGFVLYQGGVFPPRFHDACIAPNTRHSASRWSTLEIKGSTFLTRAAGDFITTSDVWFRPVESTVGPDGALYVADWYDHNISHSHPQNRGKWYMPSRFDGRVWRVAPPQIAALAAGTFDLQQQPSDALLELLEHPNDWYARQVRRILAERKDVALLPRLQSLALDSTDQRLALQGLWSTYVTAGLTDTLALRLLNSSHEYVRAWTVRLLGDAQRMPSALLPPLIELARHDPSVVVRSQLACTAKRLPADQALPVVAELLQRDEDQHDAHVPLLLWWAVEDKAVGNSEPILQWFESPDRWQRPIVRDVILERLARRYTAEDDETAYAACGRLLQLAPSTGDVDRIARGMLAALAGRRLDQVPEALQGPLAACFRDRPRDLTMLQLALRLAHPGSVPQALAAIRDGAADPALRKSLMITLGEIREASAIDDLLVMLSGEETADYHAAAISALAYFDDPRIGDVILAVYPQLTVDVRARALDVLCGRRTSCAALLEAVQRQHVPQTDISASQLKQILELGDPQIEQHVTRLFGVVQPATRHEIQGRIFAVSIKLNQAAGDASRGRIVFEKTCASCHRLHGVGNIVGPELSVADTKMRQPLLTSIIDPSAMIRPQYIAHVVETSDGRVLTGLLAESTDETITLLDAKNQRTLLQRSEISELRESPVSLMPERLLDPLSDAQIRDLFAFLESAVAPENSTPATP